MSSHIPGNVSTYNEASAPLLERLKRKRSHMPFDFKTAFNKLLNLSHNAKSDDCIDAADELLKQQLPESYRMRTHIVLATCLEDLDEMEEHHAEALRIWTRLNTRYTAGENPNADVWLQQARAQIDCLWDTIEEERNIETDESDDELNDELDDTDSASTPKLSMSAIAAIQLAPATSSNRFSSASDDDSGRSGAATSDSEDTTGRTRGTRSTDVSPTLSVSSNAVPVHSDSSRLFGAIALPGQRRGLLDHIGMSPATIIKLAWDPKRTVRGRSLKQPSKKLPPSPS